MFPERRNDAYYVRQTLSGQQDAYRELVDRYVSVASAFASSCLRTRAEAEEVAQESLVRAYEKLNTLRDPNKFGSWLIGIVRNCAGRVNERHRQEATFQDRRTEASSAPPRDFAQDELIELVRAEVAKLPQTQREIVLLRYFSNRSAPEIAGLLDVSHAAVRKQLERARKQLGEQLLDRVQGLRETDHDLAKKTLALVAASTVAWRADAASVATGASSSVFAGLPLPKVAAVIVVIAAASWFGWQTSQRSTTVAQPQVTAVAPVDDAHFAEGEPAESEPVPTDTQVAALPTNETPQAHNGNYAIGGLVLDAFGEPAERAKVAVRIIPGIGSPDPRPSHLRPTLATMRALTGTDGRFLAEGATLTDWANLTAEITAELPGQFVFSRIAARNANYFDTQWDMRLAFTAPLSGNITTREGAPVSGATLYPFSYESHNPVREYTMDELPKFAADSSGRFEAKNLYAGRWKFFVQAPGFAPRETEFFDTDEAEVNIVLERGSRFSGRLIFANEPVPSRELLLRLDSNARYYEHHVAKIDPSNGQFTFDSLGSGAYQYWIDHPEYAVVEPALTPEFPSTSGQFESDVTVVFGGAIEGMLVDARTRQGLAGVTVVSYIEGDRRPPADAFASRRVAVTDSDGRFQLKGLPDGTYAVAYRNHPSLPPVVRSTRWPNGPIEVTRGRVTPVADWEIDRQYRFEGMVRGEDGKPAPDALVETLPRGDGDVSDAFLNPMNGILAYAVDSGGHFVVYFPAPASDVYVRAVAPGRVSRQSGPITIDGVSSPVTLDLEPAGSISGTVVDRGGRPAIFKGLSITGQSTGPIVQVAWTGSSYMLMTSLSSGSFGRFHFGLLPTDTYTIATEQVPNAEVIALAQGEHRDELRIPLYPSPSGLLRGRVTMGGVGVPNCSVGTDEESTSTDENGEFVLSGDTPTDAQYRVFMAQTLKGVATRRELVGALRRDALEFEFGSGPATVEGVVRKNGAPWPRVTVTVTNERDDGAREVIWVETNAAGNYRLEGLPQGRNEVRIGSMNDSQDDGTSPRVEVELSLGMNHDVDLTFDPGRINVDVRGMTDAETGIVRVIPGTRIITEMTESTIEELQDEAIAHRPLERDGVQQIDIFREGRFTIYVASYDKTAASVAEALDSLRFFAVPIEVIPGYVTSFAVDLEAGPSQSVIEKLTDASVP